MKASGFKTFNDLIEEKGQPILPEKKYRVVTNGVRFAIQQRTTQGFLWWKWETWEFRCRTFASVGGYRSEEITFAFQREAENYIASLEIEERAEAMRHDWRPA